ncbi:MAG: CPBP family intramembrane metalloprotease [Atopobiaceae bacterium]|nr:CPBP family intramembrane metalloprotease [Atopobiaceae bacterium]
MPEIKMDIRKDKNMLMALCLALTAVTYLAGRLVTPVALSYGLDDMIVRTIVRAVCAVVFMVLLGGAGWLLPNLQKIRDSWRYTRPLVLINIVIATLMGTWATFLLLFQGDFSSEQLKNFAYITALCIFVGINEEGMFRGLLFGGLLAGLGRRKDGPLWAAIISSVAFGFIHVAFDINYGDLLSIVQGLLKTIETGMMGFVLCVAVLEGRNIVGAMTVHAFFDWVLMIQNGVNGVTPTATYVSSDQTVGFAAIIMYLILMALYAPKTIESVKRLRAMPVPQYGPFVPEEESAKIVIAKPIAQGGQPHHPADATPAHLRRERAHKVLDHKIATIPASLISFLVVNNLVSVVWMIIFGSGTVSQVLTGASTVAISIALLFGFQRLFANEFDGMVGWSTQGLLYVLPALVLAIPNIKEWFESSLNNPLICLVLSMAPGFSEEVVFRAIPGANWMRMSGERSEILKCVLTTSVGFSLIHGINLFAGAALSSTLFQLFYAFCLGTLFCAVFLRTGSIWPCIIVHTLIDFTSFMTLDMEHMGVLSSEIVLSWDFWLVVVGVIGLVAWAGYLLRPAKQAEIVALWKEKWHKA